MEVINGHVDGRYTLVLATLIITQIHQLQMISDNECETGTNCQPGTQQKRHLPRDPQQLEQGPSSSHSRLCQSPSRHRFVKHWSMVRKCDLRKKVKSHFAWLMKTKSIWMQRSFVTNNRYSKSIKFSSTCNYVQNCLVELILLLKNIETRWWGSRGLLAKHRYGKKAIKTFLQTHDQRKPWLLQRNCTFRRWLLCFHFFILCLQCRLLIFNRV